MELEDPRGLAPAEQVEGLRIVQGNVVQLDLVARRVLDHRDGVLDDGQVLQPQEVHLGQADVLHELAGILGDDRILVARLVQRHIVGQFARRDHHARRVHGRVTGQAFQGPGILDQLAFRAAAVGHLLQFRDLVEGPVEGDLQFAGHQLGHAVHVAVGHAQDAAHVADRRLRPHGTESDDLGHAVLAVFLHHVVDDLVAFAVREVDVDVGHADALGIQEAFEKQPVADGIDVRNAQHVRHHASQAGPPRHQRDALLRGEPGDVLDDEEVARIAHLADDAQFVFEAGLQLGSNGVVPLLHPVERQLAQVGVRAVIPFGQREVGEFELAHFQLEFDGLGDGDRVRQGAGNMAEELAHLIGVLEVKRIRGEPEPLGVVQFLPGLNADQHVLGGGVALLQIVGVVGRDDGEVELPGEIDHRVVDGLVELQSVVLDLQVEIGSEDLLELGALRPRPVDLAVHHQVGQRPLGAGGQGDQPFAVLLQQVPCPPGACSRTPRGTRRR